VQGRYGCTLNAEVLLTGGLQKPSILEDTVYPFDVTLQRKMVMSLLLKQPLIIGTGSTETTTTPPGPPPDYTWLIIGLVVLGLIILIIIVWGWTRRRKHK
jgi:hypothetical protein